MAATELKAYLKYGTIKNSVNLPDCESMYTGKVRIGIINKNIPNMVGSITAVFAKENINIDNMINKSKGDMAYTLIDLDSLDGHRDAIIKSIEAIEGVVRARIVREN